MSSQASAETKKVTIDDFVAKKGREKIVMLTAYDVLFARLVDESGVDCVLVGDSVGNVVSGLETTLPVTLDQMIYHARAVHRGVRRALLIVDMPFLTFQVSSELALLNAGKLMQKTAANGVKLEGGSAEIANTVRLLVGSGIPVMGHLGFTPQSVRKLGRKVQGRDETTARQLEDDAKRLQDAGAFSIVLELLPAKLAERITQSVKIPTIGIGAGRGCDGQVLVLPDLLGMNDQFSPKFLKRYANLAKDVREAVTAFARDVRDGSYPDDEHSF